MFHYFDTLPGAVALIEAPHRQAALAGSWPLLVGIARLDRLARRPPGGRVSGSRR